MIKFGTYGCYMGKSRFRLLDNYSATFWTSVSEYPVLAPLLWESLGHFFQYNVLGSFCNYRLRPLVGTNIPGIFSVNKYPKRFLRTWGRRLMPCLHCWTNLQFFRVSLRDTIPSFSSFVIDCLRCHSQRGPLLLQLWAHEQRAPQASSISSMNALPATEKVKHGVTMSHCWLLLRFQQNDSSHPPLGLWNTLDRRCVHQIWEQYNITKRR